MCSVIVSRRECDHDLHNLAVNLVISMIIWLVECKYNDRYRHPIKFDQRACGQYIILVIDVNKHKWFSVLEWSQSPGLGAQLALTCGSLIKHRAGRLCEMNNAS